MYKSIINAYTYLCIRDNASFSIETDIFMIRNCLLLSEDMINTSSVVFNMACDEMCDLDEAHRDLGRGARSKLINVHAFSFLVLLNIYIRNITFIR